jgi:DNA topoisomerase VI subunit B
VSVAEFFEKNRHLLGYENPTKALITIVKESVDNSLDATNEAGIVPDIKVVLKEVGVDRFRIVVVDNGPGVVEEKIPLAFGKLLYGSKFHRLRQSRGTQGIGISGAILYSQLTTGKHAKITSSIGKSIYTVEMLIDVTKNYPIIVSRKEEKNPEKWHGIRIEMEAEGRYIEGRQSVPEFLKQTAIANPYAKIIYDGPGGEIVFNRTVQELPVQPKEIKPHPYGVELGILRRMVAGTQARNLTGFLTTEFSRVGRSSAEQMLKLAKLDNKKPKDLVHEEAERLHKAIQMVKLVAPPTDCLSPMGEGIIEEGLKKEVDAEFFVAVTRPPAVYRGNPFQIEVGLAYGGKLFGDSAAQLFRFANRVPLIYHQSDCATYEATIDTDWKRYGFSQSQGQLPQGSLVILVHFASVYVPYTSEGKQAIADYPEIVKEMKLALQEAGRRLSIYVRQKNKKREAQLRRDLFERYIPELAESLEKLTEEKRENIIDKLEKIVKKGVKRGEETRDEKKSEQAGK